MKSSIRWGSISTERQRFDNNADAAAKQFPAWATGADKKEARGRLSSTTRRCPLKCIRPRKVCQSDRYFIGTTIPWRRARRLVPGWVMRSRFPGQGLALIAMPWYASSRTGRTFNTRTIPYDKVHIYRPVR